MIRNKIIFRVTAKKKCGNKPFKGLLNLMLKFQLKELLKVAQIIQKTDTHAYKEKTSLNHL